MQGFKICIGTKIVSLLSFDLTNNLKGVSIVEITRESWHCENTKKLIDKKTLKPILKRDNYHGIIHFSGHILAIVICGWFLLLTLGSAWSIPFFIGQGLLLAFLFAPLHECIHSSAFKARRLNKLIGHICGLLILRPFLYSKYRHMAHHTWTQHPTMDPDQVFFPRSIGEYIGHISSVKIWHRLIKNMFALAAGKLTSEEKAFIPKNEVTSVIWEARFMLATYVLIAAVSVWLNSALALYLWLGPRIVGEIGLRAFRMVEHTGMEESPNMLANTRTTQTNFLVRALYWNMPYHAEHHLYPNVPFHALPELHKHIRPHLKEVGQGVVRVHAQILRQIWSSKPKSSAADQ